MLFLESGGCATDLLLEAVIVYVFLYRLDHIVNSLPVIFHFVFTYLDAPFLVVQLVVNIHKLLIQIDQELVYKFYVC